MLPILIADLRHNRARRVRHGISWRLRKVADRVGESLSETSDGRRIYSSQFGPEGERLLATIVLQMQSAGTPFMRGATDRRSERTIHVSDTHVNDVLALLLATGNWPMLFVEAVHLPIVPLDAVSRASLISEPRSFCVYIVEYRAGRSQDHYVCSRLQIAVWSERVGAYDKAYQESDLEFARVGRLTPPVFAKLTASNHSFDDDLEAPQEPKFPVDIVYTWVDGTDPGWLAQKARFSRPGLYPERAKHAERFRNRDELLYSLRSIELFAPWVQTVHIVTAGQTPRWLNLDAPKLNLVDHREIYADSEWLPTFNSSGIETQLHHIDGLADHFLYFNDDFFLGQFCDKGDFFFANGVIKYFPSDQRAYERGIDSSSEEYIQADKNAIELLRLDFDSVGREIMQHIPYPSDRELLAELEERYKEAFEVCAASRFRSSADVRPIAFMQYHYGFHRRRAMPSSLSHRYLALWKNEIIDQMESVERSRAYKTFCINDVGLQPHRTDAINSAVQRFLDAYFPVASAFER